mgnify:CR=1 FL=1
MNERFINLIKWIVIAVVALCIINTIVITAIVLWTNGFFDSLFEPNKKKDIQPIIDYIEGYRLKNKVYPKELIDIKLQDDSNVDYYVSKDSNCYTLNVKNKKHTIKKQYKHCAIEGKNSFQETKNYIEYRN